MLPEGWSQAPLSDFVAELDAGVSVKSEDRRVRPGEVGVLKTSAVTSGKFDPNEHKAVVLGDVARVRTSPKRDSIIISRMNTQSLVGASAYVERDYPTLFLPDRLWQVVLREPDTICARWLSYVLRAPAMRDRFSAMATGTSGSMKNLSKAQVLSVTAPVPPLPEQRAIAAVLSSVDETVEKTKAVVSQLDVVRKSLATDFLSRGVPGRHEVYKRAGIGGSIPASWSERPLGDLARHVRTPVQVEQGRLYREIGVRSHCKGVFHKESVAAAALGAKRVFWVEPGCVVLNIVFAWEGAVAATSEAERGFIASHRFPMLKPNEGVDLHFLRLVLQSKRGVDYLKSISPGGAGRNKTLNQSALLRCPVPLPPIEEQKAISEAVVRAEAALERGQATLDQLVLVRRGLLDALISGRLRVNMSVREAA